MANAGDSVGREQFLWRRSYLDPPHKHRFTYPGGLPTSRVFKLRQVDEGKLSVDVKSLTTYDASVKSPSRFTLYEVANSDIQDIGLDSVHDPIPKTETMDENPAHALIAMDEDDDITPGLIAKKAYPVIREI